jgi:NAD(P)H-dependent FMN reductase
MITIISGTNREGSNSLKVAKFYASLLSEQGVENQILDLKDLPNDFLSSDLYGNRSQVVMEMIEEYIEPVSQFVFILPEYHGGFPGVAKLFLDAIEPAYFYNKKAAMVGLSSGRAGNLRGLDSFGNVLNYMQVEVLSDKVKLSGIEGLLNGDGKIVNEETILRLNKQIGKIVKTLRVIA